MIALGLWHEVGRQWRMGFNGPVGLDWPAVFHMAEWLGVDMTMHDYHKLRALEMHTLRSIAARNRG